MFIRFGIREAVGIHTHTHKGKGWTVWLGLWMVWTGVRNSSGTGRVRLACHLSLAMMMMGIRSRTGTASGQNIGIKYRDNHIRPIPWHLRLRLLFFPLEVVCRVLPFLFPFV